MKYFNKQIITASAIIFLLSANINAQDLDQVTMVKTDLSASVFMLKGAGGNIAFCTGDDGLFMIDDQFSGLTEKIKEAIGIENYGIVNFLINTHWHPDHTGGNEDWANFGSIIVAHKNVRKRMSEKQFIEFFENEVEPFPGDALPIVTFSDEVTFYYNNEEIYVRHFAHAHTDGDAVVYFLTSNVVHMGDIYFAGTFPFFDISSGGSIVGLISAIEKILPTVNDSTKIIPGHGELSNKSELAEQLIMLKAVTAKIMSLLEGGKSEEEILSSDSASEFADKWGNGFVKADQFVKMVYQSLKN